MKNLIIIGCLFGLCNAFAMHKTESNDSLQTTVTTAKHYVFDDFAILVVVVVMAVVWGGLVLV